jgi:hypothetical protein
MIDEETIALLRLLHGMFNSLVLAGFIVQAMMGLNIRRGRKSSIQNPDIIRFHRKLGPVLSLFGLSGFFAGLILVYLDKGKIMEFPLHFLGGIAVVLLISATFLASRTIRGQEATPRSRHAVLGALLLITYVIQAFLGLGVLL